MGFRETHWSKATQWFFKDHGNEWSQFPLNVSLIREKSVSLIDFETFFQGKSVAFFYGFSSGSSVGFGFTMNELHSLESQLQSLDDVEEKVSQEKEEVFSSQLTLFGGCKIF